MIQSKWWNFFLFILNQLKCYSPTSDFYSKYGFFHSYKDQNPILGNNSINIEVYYKPSILSEPGGTEFIKDMGLTENYVFSGNKKFTIKDLKIHKII